MSYYKELNDYIEKRRDTYRKDPDIISSFYTAELGTAESYNSRQLLELLQNVDDAASNNVQIKLDTKSNTLEVSNMGAAFSLDGVKSLMLANKSPKSNNKNYIGNKGLGFRSILNWASEIQIITRDLILKFSPEIAKDEFDEIVTDPELRDRLFKEKRKEHGLVPFPVLGIPRVLVNEEPDYQWLTTIRVKYKPGFEKDIKDQLNDIRPEILLFLNHIKNVEIIQDSIFTTLVVTEEKRNGKTFRIIGNREWEIADTGDLSVSDTDKLYRFKVAFTKDLNDHYNRLFTYFPTKVPIQLPYLIHATFDLDPARNYLTPTDYNKYILKELATFLGKIALELKGIPSNWLSYRFLQPLAKETNALLNEFYQELDNLRTTSQIFPCVDGNYRYGDQIVFYKNDFSQWLVDIKQQQCLPEHLLYSDEKKLFENSIFKNKVYSPAILKANFDLLSSKINYIQDRKDLMDFLLDDSFKPYPIEKFSILIDEKGDIISSENTAYTPIIESENIFHRPSYVKFSLINRELYSLLVTHYRSKFVGDEQESRKFKNYFDSIANIQPYDSKSVITKIISAAKLERSKVSGLINEQNVIKEMVKELFKNYQLLKTPPEKFSEPCLLISKSGDIKESDSLWINSSFPSGALTEELYESIFKSSDYVAEPITFGVESNDASLIERFFIWLGVNKYLKYKEISYVVHDDDGDPYVEFCYGKNNWSDNPSRYQVTAIGIDNAENTINKLSPEKLLLLALKEEKIKQRLGHENDDELVSMYGSRKTVIHNKPSYISFQLESIGHFNNFLADDEGIPYLNNLSLNIDDGIFRRYGIKGEDLRYVLYKLGAKISFLELSLDRVYSLIKQCGEEQWKEEYARKLYHLSFNYFKANSLISFDSIAKEFSLLARQGHNMAYKTANEIYYSDNKTMPEKILSQYWTFDFPKRNGEEQISRFFGVKNFKEIAFQVKEFEINRPILQVKFDDWLAQIKPYILAYRLQTLQAADEKRNAASVLKRCQIRLFSSLTYSITDNEDQNLETNEFVIIGREEYVICIGDKTNLEDLQRTPEFCDCVAEIFCILFKVNDGKNSYRSIFKDALSETKHLIKQDSLLDQLNQAHSLLGISRIEYFFWKNIFSHLDRLNDYPDNVPDQKTLINLIQTNLGISLPPSYQSLDLGNIDSDNAVELLKFIADKTQISETRLLQFDDFKVYLYEWYCSQLRERILISKPCFRKLLHTSLASKSDNQKVRFIDELFEYDGKIGSHCLEQIKDYEYSLNLDIDRIVTDTVFNIYGFNINECQGDLSIKKHYESLFGNLNIDENELTSDIRSMLFFEGFEEKLNEVLLRISSEDQPLNESTELFQPEFIEVSEIKAATRLGKSKRNIGGDKKWKHNKNSDRVKKAAGKQSEILVMKALINKYPNRNVEWISGYSDTPDNTDSLHYDIRYTDNSGILRYVEVKTFNNGSFILTGDEREFAMQNKQRYDIALVTGNKVQYIKSFFSLPDDEAFERNSLFSVRPNDFEIGLEIETIE